MNLVALTLENYRSIRQSHRLLFGNRLTALIGPNNEGKSNIIRALIVALKGLARYESGLNKVTGEGLLRRSARSSPKSNYFWERDFPVAMQDEFPEGTTRFVVEFDLTAGERKRLKGIIGTDLSGFLAFELRCGANDWLLAVRDAESLNPIPPQQIRAVCRLVSQAIKPLYIPSLRTAESAQEIVQSIVRRELAALESRKEYRAALRQVSAIQKKVLAELSKSVTATLREFLPTVKRVRVELTDEEREEAISQACSIIVNDGTETDLRQKGDGVQSLAAMSLMRHAALLHAGQRKIILAVEEPETHLHSRAIHQLRSLLNEIAFKNQVIITTHNPVFVNRENIATNILVSANNASPAETTEQIRETLGVRPADNLRHAEVVLVVEGEDDRIALTALLSYYSKRLRAALADGLLVIDPLHGSSNLSYKLSLLRAALCSAFVFLDNDVAGKRAAETAIADRVLSKADVKYALCRGKAESELEDLYVLGFYEVIAGGSFGVTLVKPLMRGTKKWSDRVRECFLKAGQLWDDGTKAALKAQIASAVARSPKGVLQKSTRPLFDALVKSVEGKIQKVGSRRIP
jgi:putative ATP-dependent endonuclease of OLD family